MAGRAALIECNASILKAALRRRQSSLLKVCFFSRKHLQ